MAAGGSKCDIVIKFERLEVSTFLFPIKSSKVNPKTDRPGCVKTELEVKISHPTPTDSFCKPCTGIRIRKKFLKSFL